MGKQLLVAGIDPGTTVAYALLGLNGNVAGLGSKKELSLNKLIETITKQGISIVVGTDKKRVPDFVEKFAVKVGARVIAPKSDLKVSEKRGLAKDLEYGNVHEMDALASAVFALKRIKSLLKKIDVFVKHYKKESIADKLTELVIKKDLSIRLALGVIEKPQQEESKTITKVIERKITEKDFFSICEKLRRAEKENKLLKQKNEELSNTSNGLKEKQRYLKRKIDQLIPGEKAEETLRFKEERLQFINKELGKYYDEIDSLKKRISWFYSIFSNIDRKVVLKKIKNLGWTELSYKNKILNIKKGDILFVDNVNEYSKKTIEFLKEKVSIIVYKQKISKKIQEEMPFVLIDSAKLKIDEDRYFAFAGKDDFEKQKSAKEMLGKIVKEYRKERKAAKEP